MNHPTNDNWVSYLYDEATAEQRANLTAHLRACPECRAKVDEWQSARKGLDAWRVRTARRTARAADRGAGLVQPLLKWAAAAVIMVGMGFIAGRLAQASVDVEKVRAAIEPELRQQLRQELAQMMRDELDQAASALLTAAGTQTRELLGEYARTQDASRAEDTGAILDAIEKLEAQRLADFISLKKDLDTVAVYTDAGLRQAARQMVQLAGYTRPGPALNSTRD
jgi:electron transfer flavoprotein alpha subunit